jgi:predicted Rossmann-fold nucleotide-binding protein
VSAWNWLERNLKDELAFASGCTSQLTIERVIHGGCRGADEGANDWAKSENIPVIACRADWKKHGKAAGPIRNREMIRLHQPDYVVALPGGRGTADMINAAEAAGIPVIHAKVWSER